jgi:hypothetical protein
VDEAAYYATWPGTTKTVRRAFGLLRRTAQAIGAQEVPYGWTYGDFKPSNLIVAENRLVAIDMDLRFREACMIDAAQFCNHVALSVPFAFIPTRIGLTRRAVAAFRRGYAETGLALPAAALAWVRLQNALRLSAKYRTWSKPPYAWLTGWTIKDLIHDLSCELETAFWKG